MRTLVMVVAVAGCGGSSKPVAAPPPATTTPAERPEPVAVAKASDPEEGGQVASASPPPAAAPPAVASDPEEGGQVASSGEGIAAAGPGLGGIGTVGAGAGTGAGGGRRVGEQHEAPRVQLQEPKVSGDIDRSIIKRVVKAHFGQIRYCYEKSLQANPSLRGTVTVTFTIEKDGKVSAAKAEGIEDNLDRCIEGRFKTFEFPKAASPATIIYPFAFATD